MAISRFSGSNTPYDKANFAAFLENNKAGTFLENMTITLTEANDHRADQIAITDGNATLTLAQNSSASNLKYTGESYNYSWGGEMWSSAARPYIGAGILCSKGLLVKMMSESSSESYSNAYSWGLTVDSQGRLSIIVHNGPIHENTHKTVVACCPDFTGVNEAYCVPAFDSHLTSLAPLVPNTTIRGNYLPYAFGSISTQLSAMGFQTAAIDGEDYITNGKWYIKDEESR